MRRTVIAYLGFSLTLLAAPLLAADPAVYSADLLGIADKGDEQALAKLTELAEGGHAQAQYDLGTHYLHTIKNNDEFLRIVAWFQKAADQGVARAQIDLAVSINMPDTPWYDPVNALKWFNIGMALVLKESPDGSQDRYAIFAVNNAMPLSRSLSKEQVADAEKRGRTWLAAHGVSAAEEVRNLDAFMERHKPQ